MIVHLNKYKVWNTKERKSFAKTKHSIRHIEIWSVIVFAIFIVITMFIVFFIIIVQGTKNWEYKAIEHGKNVLLFKKTGIWKFSKSLESDFIEVFVYIVEGLIIVFEVVLFFMLRKKLMSELNFFFWKIRYNLIILTITTCLFFALQLMLKIHWKYFSMVPDKVSFLKEFDEDYDTFELVICMFVDLLSYAPLVFHGYYNIKNIKFKLYIENSMKGVQAYQHYLSVSIFVKRSWLGNKNSLVLTNGTKEDDLLLADDDLDRDSDDEIKQSDGSRNQYMQDFLDLFTIIPLD